MASTILNHVDTDLVACVCGHIRDEHRGSFFAPCTGEGCECEDYAADEADAWSLLLNDVSMYTSRSYTLDQVREILGEDPQMWRGRCFELASKLHQALTDRGDIPGSRAVYGHYVGFVHPEGYFGSRAGLGWVQHGWIDLGDGNVIDPTRWVLENVDPYLYEGPGDDYDEGGNRLRATLTRPCPSDDADATHTPLALPAATADWLTATSHLRAAGATHTGEESLVEATSAQLFWLANLPLDALGEHARPVYQALRDAGQSVLIPIDNRFKILGD